MYTCLNSPSDFHLNTFYNDFQKASHKVSLEQLLQKLGQLGFVENCLKLLCSYLRNLKMSVRLVDKISSLLDVYSGVPQSYILELLFFVLFMDDPPSCAMSRTSGYAHHYKVVGRTLLYLTWTSGEPVLVR